MTNKERLQANNAKIEEIQRTLNGKVLEANKDMKKLLDGTLEEFDNNVWGLTSLRDYQFQKFKSLKKIDLTGITEIPAYAFDHCENVEDIVFDKNTHKVGGYGFADFGLLAQNKFEFESNVDCELGDYAFNGSNISKIKGTFGFLGNYIFQSCSNLTDVDVSVIGSKSSTGAFIYCKKLQNLKINFDNFTGTTLGSYFANRCGTERNEPENNIFVFDLEKTSIKEVGGYAFGGEANDRYKYVHCFLPKTLTKIGAYIFQYSDNCELYLAGETPATLGSNFFKTSTNYKIFVPYNAVNAYKTATNWTAHANYIYGWAEENTFEQGKILPKYSAEGFELTWYSDKNMTTQVTSVDDSGKVYYCTIGATQVEVVNVTSVVTDKASVSIVDNNGNQWLKGDYIPVGTQLTITTTPTTDGYIPYNQTINGEEFTSPYTYTTTSGTNIDIVAIYWNGVDLPVNLDFTQNSWAMIKNVVQQGRAGDFWSVGDVKEIEIDGLTYGVRLSDLQQGRYDYSDGSRKTNAVFEFVQLYNTSYSMNATNTNAGGWATAELQTTINTTILNKMPIELRSLLEQVVVASANTGSADYEITTSDNYLFIPCALEVNLTTSYGREGEGTTWDYYINAVNATRVKMKPGSTSGTVWWLRSPYPDATYNFGSVAHVGNGAYNGAYGSGGVCPCFAW